MRVWLLLGCALGLAACGTPAVKMRNPETGQVATCGPYVDHVGRTLLTEGAALREIQCVRDYKEQGFVRVP